MHLQVIVSRKDATNTIKLIPMNTSRGKNEEHSKRMGQFDRMAFKQSGESLFDSLFEFDRQLKETMKYANTQKNGRLHERLQVDTSELEIPLPSNSEPKEGIINHPANDIEMPYFHLGEQIHFNITDDVDDEAVYGRNRHRQKPRAR